MPLNTGQVLNQRYRIVKLLGKGGFGAVYRAWDISLKRPCALKENLDTSSEARRQFEREARILANLSHPNLVRVTDYFFVPDQGQYLLMDFVEGEDLKVITAEGKGPVREREALTWIGQVCDALAYLHSQDPPVIHRDIKPANIKITPDGRAILVDFGIAKIFDARMRTTVGARAITPGYSPPEQYGQGATDARSDVYAIGATLYTLLTGQTPPEAIQRGMGTQLPPPRSFNPSISPATEGTIIHAMEFDPSQRFQDVQAFKTSLTSPAKPTEVIRPAQVTEASPVQVTPARVAPTSAPPTSVPPASAPAVSAPAARGIPWGWIGVGVGLIVVVLLAVALVGGLTFIGGSDDQDATQNALERTQTSLALSASSTPTPLASPTQEPTEPVQIPPTSTSAPVDTPVPADTPVPPPPAKTSARVLWDVSHGPRQGSTGAYDPEGVYSGLVELLSGQNITVESGGLNALAGYDALVIGSTSAQGQSYTPDEAALIAGFVRDGGGLLILGEESGFANRVAEVADVFGVRTGGADNLTDASDLSGHPIFEGVTSVNLYQGGSLGISSQGANAVAWQGDATAVVVNEDNTGRVVVIGDSNLFDNRWLGDNQGFASNLFRWITFLSP